MTSGRMNFFIFDDLDRFIGRFVLFSSDEENGVKQNDNNGQDAVQVLHNFDITLNVDGYLLYIFHVLKNSVNYHKLVRKSLLHTLGSIPKGRDINVRVRLIHPVNYVLDYGWNDRINHILRERLELDNAMSWLSTLGGAFSALGDNFEHCAKVAGKISIEQLHIALRLGEPPLVARCKLYMALSLIQQKNLKVARKIIEEQYKVAKKGTDLRLLNMCKGIWAKLQYTHQLEKINKCTP